MRFYSLFVWVALCAGPTSVSSVVEGPGLRGFENPGNSCWLNSIVQLLLHSELFLLPLTAFEAPLLVYSENRDEVFGVAILNELRQIGENYYGSESIHGRTLGALQEQLALFNAREFSPGLMADANEGLRVILGLLPDALRSAHLPPGLLGEDLFGIEKIFDWCHSPVDSHASVRNSETLFDLGLSVLEGSSLVDLLANETKEERVDRRCAECGCEGTGTLSSRFTKLPPILIVHLKRFNQLGRSSEWR